MLILRLIGILGSTLHLHGDIDGVQIKTAAVPGEAVNRTAQLSAWNGHEIAEKSTTTI